jgi:uncharacterized damage-inducible protein DinB
MTISCAFLAAFLLLFPNTSQAQSRGTPQKTAEHTNSQELDYLLVRLEPRILDVANAMPADNYGFVPTAGEFKGVRSFAEQLKHIAADNYLDGAAVLGENPPGNVGPGESGSASVKTKPEIVAYVKDSFEYVRRAAQHVDDRNQTFPNPDFLPYGPGMTTRMHILLANIGHTNDHYGQLVEYLRMNGIVPPESRPLPQAHLPVTVALDFWITNTESEVVPAAAAMPEQKYSFAPSSGEFSGVRTFAQQLKHLAANNYRMAAYISGQKPTPDQESETGPDEVRSKPQIMEYLRGSFAALHQAVASIDDQNMLQPMALHLRQNTRLQLAIDAVAHSYDHYGQMVEYLRMNGIVPPASRR